jgi:hypothetical protein
MNDNPYAAPKSSVTDVEPAGSLERPRIVVFAVRVLWASLLVAVPTSIYDVLNPSPGMTQGMTLVLTLFGWGINLAIAFWLYSAAWKGKGYARWVLAGLTAFGFALIAWLDSIAPEAMNWPWHIQAIWVVSNILGLAGNGMLFAPSANAWYREMKRRR